MASGKKGAAWREGEVSGIEGKEHDTPPLFRSLRPVPYRDVDIGGGRKEMGKARGKGGNKEVGGFVWKGSEEMRIENETR